MDPFQVWGSKSTSRICPMVLWLTAFTTQITLSIPQKKRRDWNAVIIACFRSHTFLQFSSHQSTSLYFFFGRAILLNYVRTSREHSNLDTANSPSEEILQQNSKLRLCVRELNMYYVKHDLYLLTF